MSQVRKYQTGGPNQDKDQTTQTSNPVQTTTVKLGKLTINGRSLEGQAALDKITTAYRGGADTGMGDMAIRAIQDGNEAIYNPLQNSIKIVDGSGNDVTKKYLPKGVTAKVSDSAFVRNWGATLKTTNDSFRKSGYALGDINMNPEELDNRTNIRFGSRDFIFDDKTGAYSNDYRNTDSLQRLEALKNYFSGTRADQDKIYKASHKDLDEMWNYADEWTSKWDTLMAHIKAGKSAITAEDRAMLNLLGFVGNGQASSQTSTTGQSAQQAAAREAASVLNPGNEAMYESMGITSTVGDDGRTHITGSYNGNDLSQGTWLLGGDYNWFDPKYKWLHNGVLYKGGEEQDKTKNYDLFNAVNNWYQNQGKTSQEWWDHAKASGIHFSGEEGNNPFADFDNTAYFDTAHNGAINRYIAGLNLPAIAINDFTKAFDNVPEGTSIYGYVNPTNRDEYGTMGAIKFFSVDPTGNIAEWNQPYGARPIVNPIGTENFSSRDPENGNNFVYHRFNLGNEDTENTILTTSTLDGPGRKFYLKREGKSRELDPNRIAELMQAIREGRITHNDMLSSYYRTINTPVSGNNYLPSQEYKGFTKVRNGIYKQDLTGKLFRVGMYGGLTPYTPKRKEGGVLEIPKFQYGGGINGSNNVLNIDNTAKHNIDKAHKMDGSDGGLTSAERLQILGALGDLAGVGVSFIPGVGNIAGAATGAAASTTRFVGDIAQDGFQGTDLFRYLGNLGLDATSLVIPAIGKTAKGAKALKTIKALAEPLMITAGAMGLGETASILGKLANGEKLTSKDTTSLIHGLSKMTLGTSAAVSISKEAKTLSKGLKDSNKAALETVKDIKIAGKQNKLTNKEVFDLVNGKTENEAVMAIAEKLGLKEPSAEVLSEIKSKFGISNIERGVLGKVVDKVGKRTQKVTIDTGEVNAKSGFSYFMNPIARYKGLNGYAKGLSAEQVRAANEAVRTSTYTDAMPIYKAQTIAKLAASPAYNLDNINFGTRTAEIVPRWTFGGKRLLRDPLLPYVVPETKVQKLPKIRMKSSRTGIASDKIMERLFNPESTTVNVWKKGKFDVAKYNRIMREYWDSRKYSSPILTEIDPLKRYLGITSDITLPPVRSASQIRWTPTVEVPPIRSHNGTVEVMTNSGIRQVVRKKEGGLIPKFNAGGHNGTAYQFKVSPLLDVGAAALQNAAYSRSYDIQRDADNELLKRQFPTQRIVQAPFDLSPTLYKFKLAEEPLKLFKTISSDPIFNMSGNLAKAQNLSNLELQKGEDISNYINNYEQQYANTMAQQNAIDAQTAKEKSAYITGINSHKKLLDSKEIHDKWANIWNTFLQQYRQNTRNAENATNRLNFEFEEANLRNKYERDKKAAIESSDLYKDYLKAKEANDKIGPFDNWVDSSESNYARYNDLLESKKLARITSDYNNAFMDLTKRFKWTMSMRRGGKIRPTNEELVIQGDRSAKRAVIRMNDNLMKMLLQLMK